MRPYSTSDTMICSEAQQNESSPFARAADEEATTVRRPGGVMVQNYRKVVSALTKTVEAFELSRQIYG